MEVKKEKKLTFMGKVGYGLGDAGGCMTFCLMSSIFQKYCTDALGISPTLLGVLWIVWNIWDFINDPLMGALMDKSFAKSKNKNGKFRPWLLRSAPIVCIMFILMFSVPSLFSGVAAICILFALKIAYELGYTMFNIPMGSLLSSMSKNDQERAALSTWRGIGSGIGNMLPMVIAPMLIAKFGGDASTKGYAIAGIVCAVIGLILSLGHYFLTYENVEINQDNNQQTDNIKVTDILNVFKVNRPFVALCLHGLFICLMQYISNTLSSYMYADVLGDFGLMSSATIVSAPFMLLVFVFGSTLAKKLGLEKMIRYSLLVSSALYISLFIVQATLGVNPYVYMIWSGVAMGIGSVSIYMQWGLVGEAIDYNEMITGKRTEGSIYGTFNLSRRVGQTIGTSASLFLLEVFGYNAKLPVQSDLTLLGIKVLCVLLPGIFVLGSWAAFKFVWNINSDTREKLKEFKEGTSLEETPNVVVGE